MKECHRYNHRKYNQQPSNKQAIRMPQWNTKRLVYQKANNQISRTVHD